MQQAVSIIAELEEASEVARRRSGSAPFDKSPIFSCMTGSA
jgi:hypothetical protein